MQQRCLSKKEWLSDPNVFYNTTQTILFKLQWTRPLPSWLYELLETFSGKFCHHDFNVVNWNCSETQLKQTPVLGNALHVFGMKRRRGSCVFWWFLDVDSATSTEAFWMIWLNICLSWKITKMRTIPVLVSHQHRFRIPLNGGCDFTVNLPVKTFFYFCIKK